MDHLPITITALICNNNCLENLDNLPVIINYLECSNNYITSLTNLPNLTHLYCSNNYLFSVTYFYTGNQIAQHSFVIPSPLHVAPATDDTPEIATTHTINAYFATHITEDNGYESS